MSISNKYQNGSKRNKAAVAKLRTICEILIDADQSRSIPDVLRKKLISAGLTSWLVNYVSRRRYYISFGDRRL